MSGFAPETSKNPNYAAHSHTSPSRLENKHPHAEQIAKNTWQPNAAKASAARNPGTAAPRGTVRGKPAYATGAFPTLAPALVRRRPRRTSRRAKRPSPQPCPSTASSGMLSRDGAARRASKCVASMACWWGRGPFENTRVPALRRRDGFVRWNNRASNAGYEKTRKY